MKYKEILIVEDNLSLNKGLKKAIESEDRHIVTVACLKEAREQLLVSTFHLIILDVNLPDGDGIEFLKEIKSGNSDVSVILLTANDTDMDIVNGLESGADDYITKPFSLSVFRARVNLQLRKYLYDKRDEIRFDEYVFDFAKQKFSVENRVVELSKTEQKLLLYLIENKGILLTREQMIDRVWGTAAYIEENALSVAIKRLRDKLSAAKYIQTVYGIGYRWIE